MLQNAVNYTRQVANNWYRTEPWSQQEQAYRLFVLALANRPDMAAMNRLKRDTTKASGFTVALSLCLCFKPSGKHSS